MNDLIKLEDGRYELAKDTVQTIITIESQIKKLTEMKDRYRAIILEKMEQHDVKEIDMPELLITRKYPTTRERLDSKTLKKDHPDLYDEYIRIEEVKGSLLVKVREQKGEENE